MNRILKIPGMLMIGAAGRKAGKTELACALIRKFSAGRKIIGVKVTAIAARDGSCPRGGKGCGVCSSLAGDYCISEETGALPHKDTARLLAAGARRVFWLRALRRRLAEGRMALVEVMGREALIVCESNSLRRVVEPGLFLMVVESGSSEYKMSAASVRNYADKIVRFDGREFDMDIDRISIGDGRWLLKEPATAIVLAGGESRRMGKNKALLPINGRPMIEYVCAQLRNQFDQILVSADEAEKYAFLEWDIVRDRVPGWGPLMGMASALERSANDLNFVVACDMPDIEMTFARRLLSEAGGYDAVVPRTGERRLEPLFAVYRKTVLRVMRDLLTAGERRIRPVFDHCRVKYIEWPDSKRPRNLNTLEEYKAYLHDRANGRQR
ncbi:MAG: molybdenum cofactor guanylyltransferase [Verrucomicrobia bacterium]|nr:molybdenum cofactor guanylyltransferase [Verrucomicrobiota bacterium]MBU4291561.1 molybdenum cofactor guanylyltransferase [Verrucomicrobiota bacterium]MBU4428827.1 molybdenum cofactor guanylyltransferase [Verrucomicrobiota bacterium]MCG2678378.1 molybdenum cofactor guanylyltransferase [Kiritimatiellia bacterium]